MSELQDAVAKALYAEGARETVVSCHRLAAAVLADPGVQAALAARENDAKADGWDEARTAVKGWVSEAFDDDVDAMPNPYREAARPEPHELRVIDGIPFCWTCEDATPKGEIMHPVWSKAHPEMEPGRPIDWMKRDDR